MFCKWCGNEIDNNGLPCPVCGKNQDALVNGNGFWDLCDTAIREKREVTVRRSEEDTLEDSEKTKYRNKKPQTNKNSIKKSNNRRNGLLLAAILILVIVLFESTIALIQTSRCRSDIKNLRLEMAGMRSSVSDGISEIEGYIDDSMHIDESREMNKGENVTDIVTEDAPNAEEPADAVTTEEKTDEAEPADLEKIFDAEETSVLDDGEIFIEAHEIKSAYVNGVLFVLGAPTENENAKVVWQRYDEQTGEWATIEEDQLCIKLDENTITDQIRALCILHPESDHYVVYQANYSKDAFDQQEDGNEDNSEADSNELSNETIDQKTESEQEDF